jgi:hypothetical protein
MRITDLLDRPIAFHRAFVTITDHPVTAIFLSQAVYWSKRTRDIDGWFYKTQAEWEDEIGLKRYDQEVARKRLRELGILEEVRRGVPARLYFRINEDVLSDLLSGAETEQSSLPKVSNQVCAISADKSAETRPSNTETTTETTTTLSKRGALGNLPSVPSRHPAVAAYLDTFEGYRLDNYQTDIVRQTVGDDPDRLQVWIKTLTDWRLSGWSAHSIPLMLDKFQRITDTRRHETDSGLVRTGTANHASGARRGPGGGRPTAAERSGGLTAAEVIDGANSALAILRANAGGSI